MSEKARGFDRKKKPESHSWITRPVIPTERTGTRVKKLTETKARTFKQNIRWLKGAGARAKRIRDSWTRSAFQWGEDEPE